MQFIYTLKSKEQALFSSVQIVRSKYNIIQVKSLNICISKSKNQLKNNLNYTIAELLKTLISI